jgi:hypothetical protein
VAACAEAREREARQCAACVAVEATVTRVEVNAPLRHALRQWRTASALAALDDAAEAQASTIARGRADGEETTTALWGSGAEDALWHGALARVLTRFRASRDAADHATADRLIAHELQRLRAVDVTRASQGTLAAAAAAASARAILRDEMRGEV